jgi:hypothetical protein
MSVSRELRFKTYNTRRNLPAEVRRKRGEANFVGAFIRSYIGQVDCPFVYGRHFAVPGCGTADFVLYRSPPETDEPVDCRDAYLVAFEAKLFDWKKALQQAYRYRYYADLAVVLLPCERAPAALAHRDVFQRLGVALWTFDASLGEIRKHVLPSQSRPLNLERWRQALTAIRRCISNLRGRHELPQTFLDRV